MNETKNLNITMSEMIENAEHFNYPYDIGEWDGGKCLNVYQSMFYQTHYYFDENSKCVDVEILEI